MIGGRYYCDSCDVVEAETERADVGGLRNRLVSSRADRILPLLEQAGVSATEHGQATFESFDSSKAGEAAVRTVREFARATRRADRHQPVKGLYLFGPTGTGKSHLVVAACRQLLLDPEIPEDSIVFDRSLRLINQIQDCYNTKKSTEAILERRFSARLWVLDDLGTEQPSADVIRRLTDIMQDRALRPMMITSNLAPEELEKRHSDFFRVVSRLGPRYFRTVRLQGADARFQT